MIRFRIIFLFMAVLTLLVILAPLILGLVSANFTYHGKCYGFTDGSWACSCCIGDLIDIGPSFFL